MTARKRNLPSANCIKPKKNTESIDPPPLIPCPFCQHINIQVRWAYRQQDWRPAGRAAGRAATCLSVKCKAQGPVEDSDYRAGVAWNEGRKR